jgi:hypothetical protein
MKVDGSCHCGAITYSAEIDPSKVTLCHCNDCQITAGSAFTFNVPTTDAKVTFTKGEPAFYMKKTAASGRTRAHAFCAACATRIYSGAVDPAPPQISLRAGPLKQRRELTPKRQIWCSAALDWSQVADIPCIADQ